MNHKRIIIPIGFLALVAAIVAGCSVLGTNPSPPTGIERLLYNTTTSTVPVLQVVTNYQVVTVIQTNTVPVTNTVGVVAYQTNVVSVQQQQAVVSTNTVQTPTYTETLKPGVATGVTAGGSILNTLFPGVGAIAVQGLLALLGGWGYLRSTKLGNTSTALAQEIEAIRTFVQTLPNGQVYDAAFVNFLQGHQAEAGVVQQVVSILGSDISNPDAKAAASQIAQFIQQLQISATPPPITPPPTAPKVG